MLKELIDKFYSDRERDKEQTHFYITDAGKCSRAVFFKFKKAPREKMEARVLRMFDHGDYIHKLIMKALVAIREVHVIASEVNIPPQQIISGRADAILSINNDLYVLDIKSINSMIFDRLEAPKEDNVNQLQLYMHFFQIPKGILLYVSKNNQALRDFIVNYDKELCQKLLANLKELKEKIDSNIIPSPLSDYPENWQCKYCQFKKICDMLNPGEIRWEEFKKQIESQES